MSQIPPTTDLTDNDKLMAALSYFFSPIVPIIILLVETMKARPYQKYHAVQSLGLFVVSIGYTIIACILFFACSIVTAGVLSICLWILFLVPLVPFVYYAIIAYTSGQYFEIPVLTKFMMQQGWLTRP
jgi:uncharacterized membrane protein